MERKEKQTTTDYLDRMEEMGYQTLALAMDMDKMRHVQGRRMDSDTLLFAIHKMCYDSGDASFARSVANAAIAACARLECQAATDEADKMLGDLNLN